MHVLQSHRDVRGHFLLRYSRPYWRLTCVLAFLLLLTIGFEFAGPQILRRAALCGTAKAADHAEPTRNRPYEEGSFER